jgi:hypothetical protein
LMPELAQITDNRVHDCFISKFPKCSAVSVRLQSNRCHQIMHRLLSLHSGSLYDHVVERFARLSMFLKEYWKDSVVKVIEKLLFSSGRSRLNDRLR